MPKPPLSHYSPVFANKPWAAPSGYATYYFDPHRGEVVQKQQGPRQWGRKRGLYSWKIESALNRELETHTRPIYEGVLAGVEPDAAQRRTWAQFLLSQVVRTPTFMHYEAFARRALGIEEEPEHDRVGCEHCGDLSLVTTRDWRLLAAHSDDYFIRSDNPVLLTGFLERPQTCLFYPMSPRICFVACSMPDTWDPTIAASEPPSFLGVPLGKGAAHMMNYHFARAAGSTVMLAPEHNNDIEANMFSDILGKYPQPPFLLHAPKRSETSDAFESIRLMMSAADKQTHPAWLPMELEPFGAA